MFYNYQQKISSAFDRLIIKSSLFFFFPNAYLFHHPYFMYTLLVRGGGLYFFFRLLALLSMSLEGLEDGLGLYLYVNVCKYLSVVYVFRLL